MSRHRRPFVLATLACTLAGCPSAAERPAVDANVPDATLPSDASDPVDSGVACAGHDATAFPTYARACASDADCTIGAHQTDCCGTLDAMGIAASEATRFATDEALCESQYPACGCDSGTVTTDDGSSPPPGTGTSAVVVRCVASVCTTSAVAP